MSVKLLLTNTAASGVLADLGSFDNAYVAPGVICGSETSAGIMGSGDGQIVDVYGSIVSWFSGVDFGSGSTSHVHIYKGGEVVTYASLDWGIFNVSSGSDNLNDGFVKGATGIGLGGESGDATNELVNSGTIEGFGTEQHQAAIARFKSTEIISVTNTGTIRGVTAAYDSTDTSFDGPDIIKNSGRMIGDINLYGEDDYYDGRLGSVKGVISAGSGNDTIFGGKENNTILGGTGIDSIYGGAGADELTGGAQGDIFLFTSVKDSTVSLKGQDTITDFAHGDLLELQSIDFNSKKSGVQHAHWIGAKDFSHSAGELRYHKTASDTYVYADTNGDGKADFAIHLDDAVKLNVHDLFL